MEALMRLRDAQDEVLAAQDDVTRALRQHGWHSTEAGQAMLALEAAERRATDVLWSAAGVS